MAAAIIDADFSLKDKGCFFRIKRVANEEGTLATFKSFEQLMKALDLKKRTFKGVLFNRFTVGPSEDNPEYEHALFTSEYGCGKVVRIHIESPDCNNLVKIALAHMFHEHFGTEHWRHCPVYVVINDNPGQITIQLWFEAPTEMNQDKWSKNDDDENATIKELFLDIMPTKAIKDVLNGVAWTFADMPAKKAGKKAWGVDKTKAKYQRRDTQSDSGREWRKGDARSDSGRQVERRHDAIPKVQLMDPKVTAANWRATQDDFDKAMLDELAMRSATPSASRGSRTPTRGSRTPTVDDSTVSGYIDKANGNINAVLGKLKLTFNTANCEPEKLIETFLSADENIEHFIRKFVVPVYFPGSGHDADKVNNLVASLRRIEKATGLPRFRIFLTAGQALDEPFDRFMKGFRARSADVADGHKDGQTYCQKLAAVLFERLPAKDYRATFEVAEDSLRSCRTPHADALLESNDNAKGRDKDKAKSAIMANYFISQVLETYKLDEITAKEIVAIACKIFHKVQPSDEQQVGAAKWQADDNDKHYKTVVNLIVRSSDALKQQRSFCKFSADMSAAFSGLDKFQLSDADLEEEHKADKPAAFSGLDKFQLSDADLEEEHKADKPAIATSDAAKTLHQRFFDTIMAQLLAVTGIFAGNNVDTAKADMIQPNRRKMLSLLLNMLLANSNENVSLLAMDMLEQISAIAQANTEEELTRACVRSFPQLQTLLEPEYDSKEVEERLSNEIAVLEDRIGANISEVTDVGNQYGDAFEEASRTASTQFVEESPEMIALKIRGTALDHKRKELSAEYSKLKAMLKNVAATALAEARTLGVGVCNDIAMNATILVACMHCIGAKPAIDHDFIEAMIRTKILSRRVSAVKQAMEALSIVFMSSFTHGKCTDCPDFTTKMCELSAEQLANGVADMKLNCWYTQLATRSDWPTNNVYLADELRPAIMDRITVLQNKHVPRMEVWGPVPIAAADDGWSKVGGKSKAKAFKTTGKGTKPKSSAASNWNVLDVDDDLEQAAANY